MTSDREDSFSRLAELDPLRERAPVIARSRFRIRENGGSTRFTGVLAGPSACFLRIGAKLGYISRDARLDSPSVSEGGPIPLPPSFDMGLPSTQALHGAIGLCFGLDSNRRASDE